MKKKYKVLSGIFLLCFIISFIAACNREEPLISKEKSAGKPRTKSLVRDLQTGPSVVRGKSMNKEKFVVYESKLMNLSFQYLPSWQIKEIENAKANYNQIHLVGPSREDIGLPVSITITAFLQSGTLKEEVDKYLSLKKRLKDFNLINRADDIWATEPAEIVEFTYLITLPLYAVEPQKVKIQEKTVFFKKGATLYKISCFVDQERFADFREALEKLKESCRFIE